MIIFVFDNTKLDYMLNRKNDAVIRNILLNDKRALLVTGARQTGKTYSIRHVAKEIFDNIVEINFAENQEAKSIFKNPHDAKEILHRLSEIVKVPMISGKTLIFFDSIQECKEIVPAVRALAEEGSFRYVLSGSLLRIRLKEIFSIPANYMSVLEMYPLDFEEFVNAVGVGENVVSHLQECFLRTKPVDDFIHQRMLELMRHYLLNGGMPAVVQTYIETKNVKDIVEAQQRIINAYKLDMFSYAKDMHVEDIYDKIPIEPKETSSAYKAGTQWLIEAGLVIPIYNLEQPIVSQIHDNSNQCKLYLNDVGLLAAKYGEQVQRSLLGNDSNIKDIALYENFVAQELYAHNPAICSYSDKQGALEFAIAHDNHLLPMEVRIWKTFYHKNLSDVLSRTNYDIPRAFILCQENVMEKGKITYLPVYMTMFLIPQKQREVYLESTKESAAVTCHAPLPSLDAEYKETEYKEVEMSEGERLFYKEFVLEDYQTEPIWKIIYDVINEKYGQGKHIITTFCAAKYLGWTRKVPSYKEAMKIFGEVVGKESNYYTQKSNFIERNLDDVRREEISIKEVELKEKLRSYHKKKNI